MRGLYTHTLLNADTERRERESEMVREGGRQRQKEHEREGRGIPEVGAINDISGSLVSPRDKIG